MNTQEWSDFADYLETRAVYCLDEADKVPIDLYLRYHLLGRASAFKDCAWMIKQRLKVNE